MVWVKGTGRDEKLGERVGYIGSNSLCLNKKVAFCMGESQSQPSSLNTICEWSCPFTLSVNGYRPPPKVYFTVQPIFFS
jgi:hypothetical protein